MSQNLNKQQQQVVDHTVGPLLVVAGAGSGKTMAITYRMASLIKNRIAHPDEILGVTFTNKAAKEMKHRVNNLVGANVLISTFHSFCAITLRRHINRFGYNSNFSIYDESDQVSVIKDVIASLNLSKDQFKPKEAANKIGRLKEDLVDEIVYENFVGNFYEENIAKIYKAYQILLKNNNAVDFADLIRLTVKLFETQKDILDMYQERYKYILVDEYQDTNYSQYKLINTIANKYKNLCVVGDPDQSIYSWRGADISNIMNFEQDYPNAKVINLEQNYRSTEIILDSANKVIEKNINRMPKNLLATRLGGNKIIYYAASDSKDEADFVCQKIKESVRAGGGYAEVAVLYRMHALSRSLEEKLMANNIPYEVIGGIKFYDRKEIKDILAYLSFLANPSDRVAFQRIINIPKRAIGPTTVSNFLEYCDQNNFSIAEGIENFKNTKILAFGAIIKKAEFSLANKSIVDAVKDLIADIAYNDYLKDYDLGTHLERIDNVKELVSSIAEFEETTPDATLYDYLGHISLVSGVDKLEESSEKIVLMTLHNAKGLEFKNCFILALEEGIFPHASSSDDHDDLEEERRLCYVGITRAKDQLYITSALRRLMFGRWTSNVESRFLADIPYDNIERVTGNMEYGGQRTEDGGRRTEYRIQNAEFESRLAASDSFMPEFREGSKIFHEKWGEGKIVSREGMNEEDSRVKIFFGRAGFSKELLLKFAKLERI